MNPIHRLCLATSIALASGAVLAQAAASAQASAPSPAVTASAAHASGKAKHAATKAKAKGAAKAASKASEADDVAEFKAESPEMQAAFKKAQATLDKFLADTTNPSSNVETITVKIGVREGKLTEYFWINPFERDAKGQSFSGTIDNVPRILKKARQDQKVMFKRADIVDWMYVETKPRVMHGNYTTCVLAKDSPRDLAALKKQYGLDCAAR
jgi:uncharacterized protein YegJ (DUF2314 family)